MSRGPTRKASSAQVSLCVLASLGLTLAITRDNSTHRSDTSCLLHSSFGQVHIKYAANRVSPQQAKSCMFNFRDDEATDPHRNVGSLERQRQCSAVEEYKENKTQLKSIPPAELNKVNRT